MYGLHKNTQTNIKSSYVPVVRLPHIVKALPENDYFCLAPAVCRLWGFSDTGKEEFSQKSETCYI